MVNITIEIDNKTFSRWTETDDGKFMSGIDDFIAQKVKEAVLTSVNAAEDIVKEEFCEKSKTNDELTAYIKAEINTAMRDAVNSEIHEQLNGRRSQTAFSSVFREIIFENKQGIIDEAVRRAAKELTKRGTKQIVEAAVNAALDTE